MLCPALLEADDEDEDDKCRLLVGRTTAAKKEGCVVQSGRGRVLGDHQPRKMTFCPSRWNFAEG